MKMQRFWVGRALLLAVAVLYAGGYVRAQEAKDTLTLTLDRALEIALSDNPTIKVAEEEINCRRDATTGRPMPKWSAVFSYSVSLSVLPL